MWTLSLLLLLVWTGLALLTAVNLLSLRRLPRRRVEPPPKGWPSVSIVIPARNEEYAIGATLDAALAQDYDRFEIIVVDDGSSDGTAAEIAARATRARLRALSASPPPPGWLGKPHALATGAAAARGEILLFMDADVRLAPETLRRGVAYAEKRRLDHLSLLPYFERVGFWEEVLMPLIGVTALMFSPAFLALSPRWKSLALGGGSFNMVRRRAYEAIGGHHRIPSSVVDDVRLAMELKRAGFSTCMHLGDHLIRLRMYRGRREIIEGFTKNTESVLNTFISRHAVFALLFVLVLLFVNVAPFLWMVLPLRFAAGLPLGLSLLALLAARVAVQLRLGYPLWPALLHPLMALVIFHIQLRSLVIARARGVIRWRGREYPRNSTTF